MRIPFSFGSDDAREKVNSAPDDFPIHFLCAVFTTDGQLGSYAITHPAEIHVIQPTEQFLAHLGGQYVPLSQSSALNQSSTPPGTAFFIYLLVRQHGVVHWIPIDESIAASYVSLLPQLEKQPLRPLVVFRSARTT